MLRLQGTRTQVIIVLREGICNVPWDSFVLPHFDDTSSPGHPPRWLGFGPSVSTFVTASCFLAGNRKDELNPNTFSFSSLLLSSVLLSFLFSCPPSPTDIVPLSAACWGYSLIIIIIIYRGGEESGFNF